MSIIVDPTLESALDEMARLLDRSVDEIANEAIRSHLEHLQAQQLTVEANAYALMHADLQAHYLGEFVAIHNGEVIDHDPKFESIFLRVQARLGGVPVLIRQVGESPIEEWHFRSPRMESF
jgi:RNA binding exosome subunit